MPVSGWKIAAVPFVVAVLSSPLSCSRSVPPDAVSATVSAGACEEMRTGDFSAIALGGPGGTSQSMKFLLTQASLVPRSAPLYEKEVIDACAELGLAAGIGEADLRAAPESGRGAETVCGAAANKVAAMFRKAKDAKIVIDVRIDQTPCFVDATAAQKCLADCGATARGDMRAACIGGELVGACQGRCAGKCTFPAGPGGGSCAAVCSGRCDRAFRGICRATCAGSCDGTPLKSPGACGGICDGSCSDGADGFCGGRCDGQCSGSWERGVPTGNCAGTCMGGCAGEVGSPLCTGEYAPPGTEATCQAACGAAAALTARCDLPVVHVVVRGGKPGPELVKLLYGVQAAVPKILRQQAAAKRLSRALQNAVAASLEWSNAYGTVGQKSFACIRASADMMKQAADTIDLVLRGTDAVASAVKTDPVPLGKGEDP
jgi:hypothetical protein